MNNVLSMFFPCIATFVVLLREPGAIGLLQAASHNDHDRPVNRGAAELNLVIS